MLYWSSWSTVTLLSIVEQVRAGTYSLVNNLVGDLVDHQSHVVCKQIIKITRVLIYRTQTKPLCGWQNLILVLFVSFS